ncbi:TatD DNase family protein [Ferrimonas sediminum]|uniref:TatD DNase family protein n=1 Tax=Ferrimonas sediminum TaxID=718193 RepID=A0A1G8PTH9_9GAMM|nr:TatD family hydrolase [Ferrimonas sediminum]SDI95771.1 TatD DNase family protein [Ferrimonas sediminum]
MLTDSHCHLDFDCFDADRDLVLQRAEAAGVGRIVVPAVAAEHWPRVRALAGAYSNVSYGVGIHPCFATGNSLVEVESLPQWLQQPGCVAIGECGLDAVNSPLSLPEQQQLLERHLVVASEVQLPLLLHVRKAHHLLLPQLDRHSLPRAGVIHGFSGSRELAAEYVRRGYFLGVGGVITYARARKTREAIASVPVDALLLETDSPDMPLCGQQGKRNEPASVQSVLQALSQLLDLPSDALAEQLARNNSRFFNRLV